MISRKRSEGKITWRKKWGNNFWGKFWQKNGEGKTLGEKWGG